MNSHRLSFVVFCAAVFLLSYIVLPPSITADPRIVRCLSGQYSFRSLAAGSEEVYVGADMGRVYRIDSSTGEIDIFDESDFGLFIGSVYLADIGNDGIVWMASDYGVFSYDGKEWNRSKNPAGIYLSTREFAHDRLGALAVDANNNVYLTVNGTANYSESYHGPNIRVDNGILRFDTQSWSFIAGRHYVLADAKEIKYQCLAFDRNNDLWYMKGRSLISFINNEEVESSVFPEGVPYPEFTEAGYDDNGVLWLASHRYPWSFDGESWREHEIKEAFSATQMTIEPGGRVWFGGKNGRR